MAIPRSGIRGTGPNPEVGYPTMHLPQADAEALARQERAETTGAQPGLITNDVEQAEGAVEEAFLPGSARTESALKKATGLKGAQETAVAPVNKATEHAEQSGVEAAENVPSWVGGIVELLKAYSLRLLEIIAGGLLLGFGLVTIVRGRPPSLPKAVPVPV